MRLGLAGGVIVVLVVFAIVMLQPGSPAARQPAPRPRPSPGSIPLERNSKMGQCSFAERVGLLEREPPSHVSDPGSDQESCCEAG